MTSVGHLRIGDRALGFPQSDRAQILSMEVMSRFGTTLLGASIAVALLAPAVAHAGDFWNPPGEDPCDNPMVNCLGGGVLDQDNWAGAATGVGEELERQASEDPVKGFIFWLAKTFGPNIPGGGDPPAGDPPAGDPPAGDPPAGDPPAGDPPAGDPPSESSASVELLPDPSFTKLRFTNRSAVPALRKALNKTKEGRVVKLGGRNWRVLQKREVNPKRQGDFMVVLVPVGKDMRGVRVKPGITLRAKNGVLYVATPKRARKSAPTTKRKRR